MRSSFTSSLLGATTAVGRRRRRSCFLAPPPAKTLLLSLLTALVLKFACRAVESATFQQQPQRRRLLLESDCEGERANKGSVTAAVVERDGDNGGTTGGSIVDAATTRDPTTATASRLLQLEYGDIFSGGTGDAGESNATAGQEHAEGEEEHEEEVEPDVAVLFPFFAIGIGIFVYFVLTRWTPWLPYTFAMFLLGTITSVIATRLGGDNFLTVSVREFWVDINGELLLVVFLPGLIYSDATHMNVHLFFQAFWQCFTFAFPMVLAGTSLTAVIAYYLLPYGWSFNLAMVFGSILSATDPVAVAALLEQVGAPPRLKVHISGESLLNDGSGTVP